MVKITQMKKTTLRQAAMKLALLAFVLLSPFGLRAQTLSEYTVTTSTETYTSIADATLLLSSVDGDDGTQTVTLPFNFPFGENTYPAGTTLTVRADGYVYFGSANPGHSSKSAWTNTTTNYCLIAPFLNYDGKITASGATSGAYCTTDDPDNPTMLIIEFKSLMCYYPTSGGGNGDYNFQLRLHSNGNISTVYGESTLSTYSSASQNFFLNAKADKICLTGSYAEPVAGTPSALPNFTTAPVAGQVITFVRPVFSCPKPTNLAATIVPGDGTRTTFSWIENREATSWQLCINDDEDNLIVMDENPFTYNGLTPEVATTAKVRAYCSSTDQSQWSNTVTFTPTDAYILSLNEGSGTNYYVPFYYTTTSSWSDYSNMASQFIIPASELASIQWAKIDKLTFYNSLASNTWGATFTVYAGETSATTQSSFTNWGSLTDVYTGTVSVSDNKMTIEFDQPFTYTNSNLLVGFKLNETGNSGSSCTWKGVSATSGSSIYSTTSSSTTQASFLPQVTIEYTPGVPPSCLPPTNLAVTANGYEATFTWDSEVENYEVVYSTSATDDPNSLTPAPATDEEFVETMTEFGDYYFWVRANCGANGYSSWVGPASVHIGYCEPTLTSTTTSYYISRFTTTGGVTNIDNSTTGAGYSYSDFYGTHSASAYPGLTVDFTITIAGGSTHGSAVWVDWNNDMTFSEDERVYHTTSYASSPHNGSFTVPANTALGDHRMRIVSDYSGSNPSNPCSASTGEFEDYKLTITDVPSCLPPTALTLSRNGNQITATWESEATSFNIDINGTVTENVTNPYVFDAELSTPYTIKVQANCDGDETSEWTNTQSITTPACWSGRTIEYTLTDSYADGWESASITVVEGCGNVVATLTTTSGTVNGTLELCGDYYQFIHNDGYCCPGEHGWTFTEGGNTLFSGSGNNYDDGEVLYTIGTQTCPKPTDFGYETPGARSVDLSWTENGEAEAWQICVNDDMDNLVDVAASDLDNGVYTLAHLEPETTYPVKIRSVCGVSDVSCWSDEITFTTDVACPAPTNANVGTPAPNQVELSWTKNGEETAWQLRVNGDETHLIDVTNDDVTIENTTVTYTLTNLDFSTEYTVVVRANCEVSSTGDGQSEWLSFDDFTTAAPCPTPVLETSGITGITGHTANVAWTGFDQNQSYVVSYRTAAYLDGTTEEFGSSLPTGWTRYGGLVDGVVAGTTELNTTSISSPAWRITSYAFSTYNATLNIYGGSCNRWFVSPEFTLTNGSVLNFDLALTDYSNSNEIEDNTAQSDDRFAVLIYANDAWTILREWNNSGSPYVYNNIPANGENVQIDLSSYSGTVKIAFYGESTEGSNGDNDIHIDNVAIGVQVAAGSWQTVSPNPTAASAQLTGLTADTPYEVKVKGNCENNNESEESAVRTFRTTIACPAPVLADVDPATITTTTATLTWTGSAASNFTVAYKAAGETDFQEMDATASPFTFPNGTLNHSTVYTVKVKANCGQNGSFNDGESEWSNEKTFTTECEAIAAQDWSQNFDQVSTGSLPICWTLINEGTSYTSYPSVSSSNSNSSPNTLYFYTYGSSSSTTITDQYAVLPEMTGLDGMRVTLQAKGYSNSSSFKVGLMSDPTDANTFTEIVNTANPDISTSYQEFKFDIPTTATESHVAIMMPKPTSYSYSTYAVYIDDISITPIPSCEKPTSPSVTANGYEATFTWVSDVDNYEVVYATSATANPDDLTPATTTDEEFVETMTALGDYYFWVRANCGANGYSVWAGPASVHIGYCVPTLTSTTTSYYISRFTTTGGVTNIDNSTTGAGYSYSDFYDNYSASAYPGLTVDFTINIAGGNTHGSAIWVDWNNDMTFSEDERVYHTTSYTYSPHNGSFNVPENTALGDYRMRIVSDYNGSNPSNPCSASTGEFEDYKLTIVERPSYVINATANPAEGGTVDGAGTYNQGSNATLTATANEGYTFVNWTLNNEEVSTDPTFTINSVSEAANYVANFAVNQYTITYMDGETQLIQQTYDYNAAVTPIADPAKEGYTFNGWNPTLPATMPAQNITVTAQWTINQYTITYMDGETQLGQQTYDYNATVTAIADPAKEGYTFNGWNPTLPATMPAHNMTVTAQWTINTYTITATANPTEGGTVVGAGTYDYNYGLTMVANPSEGYYFVNWTKGGEVVSTNSSFSITVTENADYVANFAAYAVYTKDIDANKWYAISTPVHTNGNNEALTSVTNLTTDNYDLYLYNENEGKWVIETSSLAVGKGYIYRRATATTLRFIGDVNTEVETTTITNSCVNDDCEYDADLAGFNLVGNPYNYPANPDRVFFKLTPAGTWMVGTDNVGVCEAVLVYTSEANATVSFEPSSKSAPISMPALSFKVSNDEFEDVAYAMFDNGDALPKVSHLTAEAPMLSIPVNGRRYAVAMLGSDCESFDLVFRGTEGDYSIALDGETDSYTYLHLLDRVTGKDVDLLRQPTYSFKASFGDLASRFVVKLRPDVENVTAGNFAFWNGHGWTIEGEGNLQVFDLLGRKMLNVELGNSNSEINISQFPSTGVYILRLGEKTQKIVVK